jgi:hypothetical protein
MDISFFIKSSTGQTVNNRTFNSGYSYFLTRGEVLTLTGVAFTEVYSYTVNALNMYHILIELIPVEFKELLKSILDRIENINVFFKKDFSDYTFTVSDSVEAIPGYFNVKYNMAANIFLYKRMYPDDILKNLDGKEAVSRVLATLQAQSVLNISLISKTRSNPQEVLNDIKTYFNSVTCQTA